MSLRDPFNVRGNTADPPKCGWLLPLPADAPPRTKKTKCGADAPFKIRVKDYASDVEVEVCAAHKAEHDETAAQLRSRGKSKHRTMPRKAS